MQSERAVSHVGYLTEYKCGPNRCISLASYFLGLSSRDFGYFFTEYLHADKFLRRMEGRRMSQDGTAQFQRSIVYLLRRVHQCATQLYMTESSDAGLTLRQLVILTAISEQEDLSQTDLVTMTGIDRSTVAGIVSRLLAKGLLERRRSPDDGRAYCVRLSKRGLKAVAGADRLYSKIEKKLLSAVPVSEANQFVSTLKAIVAAQTSDELQRPVPSS
jgi:DNA-binding MarR family transcriptional regulator